MNQKKRTVFQQVLIVNMILSMLFICIFAFNYIYSNYKFKQEAREHSDQILQTMAQNIQAESVRLTSFMEMCKKDRSFVMAFSNRLSISAFVKYAREASEKISLIKYSLPYAEHVYAYVKNNEKFILPQNIVMDKNLFNTDIFINFNTNGVLPDFGVLEDGFHLINNKLYYINNCFDYGVLVIQINADKFSGISDVSAILPNYNIVILDRNNNILVFSSEKGRKIAERLDIPRDSFEYIHYLGEKYYLKTLQLQNNMKIILMEEITNTQKFQQKSSLMYMLAGCILFIGCGLLIFLNTSIYLPLKVIAKKIGEKGNEIELINGKINEMISENMQMQLQIVNNQNLKDDIELNYAIHAKQDISDKLVQQLKNQFGKYRMMVVAVQNQTGGGEELFELMNDYYMDTLECRPVIINQFVQTYIIPTVHNRTEILDILEKYFNKTKPNLQVYVGISDISGDFMQIHNLYRQCYERMLSNHIPIEKRYTITIDDNKATWKAPDTISIEVINTIAKYTIKGSVNDIKEIFENIFFTSNTITLKDCISYYRQLSSLVSSLINQSNTIMKTTDFTSIHNNTIYNPVYMYYTLLEDFKILNAGISQNSTSLKYEIIDYINQHFREQLSLESISSVFGITPVYLSSWFKKNTGINLSVYITNIRMEEAKKILLSNLKMKISDIAVHLGMTGASTFIRQFKNYTGCTPEQYRQLNCKK